MEFCVNLVKKDISSLDLANYGNEKGLNAIFFDTRDQLKQYLLEIAQPNDRIVLMGARDNSITDLGYELLEKLKWAY